MSTAENMDRVPPRRAPWLISSGLAGLALLTPCACGAAPTTAAPLDVRDFGVACDGTGNDAPGINRAIREAEATGNLFVYIPPGTCWVRQESGQGVLQIPIRPEVDGLTLFGDPDEPSRIILDADSFAILVNKGDTSPPGEVRDLSIRDLVIEVPGGRGLSNGGVVQINNATGFHAADLTILMNGPMQHLRGIAMDGLTTSQGTTGLIERVLVDGSSKPGIYLASGTHHMTVQHCETRNAWNQPPVGAPPPGVSISDAHHVWLIDHRAHHNLGAGLLVATNGLPPVRIPGLPAEAYGSYYPEIQAHGPATTVEVIGGDFSENKGGSGIHVGSGYLEVPRDIRLSGVIAEGNGGPGILVEAGVSVDIEGAVVGGNGIQGVLVRDVVLQGQAPEISRTSDVRVMDSYVFDNGKLVNVDVSGIEIRGRARQVILLDNLLELEDSASRQRVGVGLVKERERACLTFVTSGTEARAPIRFGQSTDGAPYQPLSVPTEERYDCAW